MAVTNFGFCKCCERCPGVCQASELNLELSMNRVLDGSDIIVSGRYRLLVSITEAGPSFSNFRWDATFPWDSNHCFNERELVPADLVGSPSVPQAICNWTGAYATITASPNEHAISDSRQGDNASTFIPTFCNDHTGPWGSLHPNHNKAPSPRFNTRIPFEIYVEISGVTNAACGECEQAGTGGANGYNNQYRLLHDTDQGYRATCSQTMPCLADRCVEASGTSIYKNIGDPSNNGTYPNNFMVSIDGVVSGTVPGGREDDCFDGTCDDLSRDIAVDSHHQSSNCGWFGAVQDGMICSGGGGMWYTLGRASMTKFVNISSIDVSVFWSKNGFGGQGGDIVFEGVLNGLDEFDVCGSGEGSGLQSVSLSYVSSDNDECDYTATTCSISQI